MNATKYLATWITAALAGLALVACSEIPQDAPKPFAGKEETRLYSGDPFHGDHVLYEKALAERAKHQNEYLVAGGGDAPDQFLGGR